MTNKEMPPSLLSDWFAKRCALLRRAVILHKRRYGVLYFTSGPHNNHLAAFSEGPKADFLISSILQTTQTGGEISYLIVAVLANCNISLWLRWSCGTCSAGAGYDHRSLFFARQKKTQALN